VIPICVLLDIKALVGSLTQNPLTKIIIDPEAFSCTQTANQEIGLPSNILQGMMFEQLHSVQEVGSNLYCLVQAVSLLLTPSNQWPYQDLVDQNQDLSALPLFITNCRPRKF
jgi:hypothetical protein